MDEITLQLTESIYKSFKHVYRKWILKMAQYKELSHFFYYEKIYKTLCKFGCIFGFAIGKGTH